MPGPAPKPADQRRRRNAPLANTLRLPADGRSDVAPAWPLRSDEPDVWLELWATPQAVAWERLGWTRVVARYAQLLVVAEEPGAGSGILLETRQLEDRLGLTPMSMLRLRWEVMADDLDERRIEKPKGKPRRLKVVDSAVGS